MSIINGKACVFNGTPVDKVFSNGKQVYGRNLLTGTSNDIKSATGDSWLVRTIGSFNGEPGSQYTASVNIEQLDHPMHFDAWTGDSNENRLYTIFASKFSSLGKAAITFVAPKTDDYSTIVLQLSWTNSEDTGEYSWKQAKVELGDNPSPWSPAPEDVLN